VVASPSLFHHAFLPRLLANPTRNPLLILLLSAPPPPPHSLLPHHHHHHLRILLHNKQQPLCRAVASLPTNQLTPNYSIHHLRLDSTVPLDAALIQPLLVAPLSYPFGKHQITCRASSSHRDCLCCHHFFLQHRRYQLALLIPPSPLLFANTVLPWLNPT
jgi:hypothetical protein